MSTQDQKTENNTQKGIKAAIIFVTSVVILGLVFLAAKFVWNSTKPSNHNEAKYGVINLRLAGWSSPSESLYVKWAKEVLPEANRLGPTFQLVESGENVSIVRSTVAASNADCLTRDALTFQGNGRTGIIRIDPVCIQGEFEFKAALLHEIGHSIGMSHVCRTMETTRSDCSSVGTGAAVLNPMLRYEVAGSDDILSQTIGAQPTWELTDLDLREAQRALSANPLSP